MLRNLKTGKWQTLLVVREEKQGYYLKVENGTEEVLLPWRNLANNTCRLGELLDVFLYRDSEDRPIATCEKPAGELGDFVALDVVQSGKAGTFLDWGLMKDLLVPRSEQRKPMQPGQRQVVRICIDPHTDRLFGSAMLDFFIAEAPADFPLNQATPALVYERSPLGYNCIVANRYAGMLYKNQLFRSLKIGEKLSVYPQKIREDGKIDLLDRKSGYHQNQTDADVNVILNYLSKHQGKMPYNDKSSPQTIWKHFKMSKKQFKKALGLLYKQRKIIFAPTGVVLLHPNKKTLTKKSLH